MKGHSHSDYQLKYQEKKKYQMSPDLVKICKDYLPKKTGPEIKYVNTLKKIKRIGEKMNCKVRVKSTGIEIETRQNKQLNKSEDKAHGLKKILNRYMRVKTMDKIRQFSQTSISNNNKIKGNMNDLKDVIENNKKGHLYRHYNSKRMETYLKKISNEKITMPFQCKYQFQRSLRKGSPTKDSASNQPSNYATEDVTIDKQENSDLKRFTLSHINSPSYKGSNSAQKFSKNSTTTRWTALLNRYEEDIAEFWQICQFFMKIQNEILKYLPNLHLQNKINKLIDQIQKSEVIKQIYNSCKDKIDQFTPMVMIQYLKKHPGILSTMNYIVNVIKLNISGQRRKRFKDVQKSIGMFREHTIQTIAKISSNFSKIENAQLKESLMNTVNSVDVSCSGLKEGYLDYINTVQNPSSSQQHSTTNNRRIICEILKFQSLIK